jgi:uncharacterized membrane protein YccC
MSGFLRKQFHRIRERETTRPDLGRATRAAFAVTAPLLIHAAGWLPLNLTFVVFAAQSVAIVDVRGAYTLRLGLLLAMTAILAGASTLGGAVSTSLFASVLGAGLVAISGGFWRHFTPDYGPSLAISSTLLFLISVNFPPATTLAEHHGLGALIGALFGVFLQIANWPINPQHPLRRAASDSWVAVADLFAALALQIPTARAERIRECESTLRITLDQAYAALASARTTPLRERLQELNLSAARLATRVVALNTALESLLATPEGEAFSASLQPVLNALTNTSRSVAVAVVSRQPAHLATCEVRMQRLSNLLRAVSDQNLESMAVLDGGAQLRTILKQIEQQLPHVLETLRSTIDRAGERAAFSLELFDLDTWTLRPLASSIILNRRPDPALVRFTARVTVLIMGGVAAFKHWDLPNGYWLPLTMVIVLQPDYGSTRQRAAQRVLGTLAGSVFASLLLWWRPPFALLTATTALTIFFFGFFLKRQYAVAVFFITLAVVLLTESRSPVGVSFTIERLASTLLGGALALLAALFFWPVWERDRLRPILAKAVEANRDFLRLIATRFAEGGGYDEVAIVAKRHVEACNSAVFSSLQRMMGDPRNRREGLEKIAAYANGNQRVTRALTVLALQLTPGSPLSSRNLVSGFQQLGDFLDRIASHLRRHDDANFVAELSATTLQPSIPHLTASIHETARREHGIFLQLNRIATELRAMILATTESSATATDQISTSGKAPVDRGTPA